METDQFLLDKFKEQWTQLGHALDDLIDSYEKCNEKDLSVIDWEDAMKQLDDDFLIVQTKMEMLSAIDTLYKSYRKSSVATERKELTEKAPSKRD